MLYDVVGDAHVTGVKIDVEGMQMPGGVTFNGRQIFDDAREEIDKLTEEARLNWEEPIDFYTG